MVTDTLSDMLTRIRNANMVKHQIVQIPTTKMSYAIAVILKEEGLIEDFKLYEENPKPYFVISLKYKGKLRKPAITKIKRISKPGLRVYSGVDNLPQVLGNLGIAIISTSRGLMTNIDARKQGIGGEILGYIW
jgi:small subunit ribosomal protein S8